MEALELKKKCFIRYRFVREMINESVVNLLGIVSKELDWYIVWKVGDKISVRVLNDIVDIQILDTDAEIPPDFNLQSYWQKWSEANLQERARFLVHLEVAKNALLLFNQLFAEQSQLNSEDFYRRDVPEWLETTLRFATLEEARYRLLGLGAAVHVLSPKSLVWAMHDYAMQVCKCYDL